MYTYIYIYTYVYIWRERERERDQLIIGSNDKKGIARYISQLRLLVPAGRRGAHGSTLYK